MNRRPRFPEISSVRVTEYISRQLELVESLPGASTTVSLESAMPGPLWAGAIRTSERILKKHVLHSRRHYKRVETPHGVWVFWRCGRTEDTSRVKDLSVGGLFIETFKACPVDATVELHFLVEDGEIKASATVRYVKAGSGLGLQFKTVRGEDQVRFSAMIKRLVQSKESANLTTEVDPKQSTR